MYAHICVCIYICNLHISKVAAKTTKRQIRPPLRQCDNFLKVVRDPKKGNVVCVQKNKELKKGDVITQQHQMAVVLKYAFGGTIKTVVEDRTAQMNAIRKVLPDIQANPKAVKALMRLQSQAGQERDDPNRTLTAERVQSAMKMNGFRLQDSTANHTLILWLWEPRTISGSVFAHACKPNACLIPVLPVGLLSTGVVSLAWTVEIQEKISGLKQVTIDYREGDGVNRACEHVDIRQDRIEKIWGFKCECALCVEQHADQRAFTGSNQA